MQCGNWLEKKQSFRPPGFMVTYFKRVHFTIKFTQNFDQSKKKFI